MSGIVPPQDKLVAKIRLLRRLIFISLVLIIANALGLI